MEITDTCTWYVVCGILCGILSIPVCKLDFSAGLNEDNKRYVEYNIIDLNQIVKHMHAHTSSPMHA